MGRGTGSQENEGKEVAEKEEGTGRMKKHFFAIGKNVGVPSGLRLSGGQQAETQCRCCGGGVGNLFECI